MVDADAMQRSIDLMQQRVNAFGVSEAELFQSGTDQIEVNLPGVTDAEAAAEQVGSTAQLFFYDWEANILDEKCKTNPDQNAANRQPVVGLRAAVEQAAKCENVGVGKGSDPLAEDSPGGESQAGAKPRFYASTRRRRSRSTTARPTSQQSRRCRRSTKRIAPTPRSSRCRPASSSCAPRRRPTRTARRSSRTAGGSSRTARA